MRLCEFVKYLTEQQHKHDPTSEVIWYDSVIDTGKLSWQDELNDKNRQVHVNTFPFFTTIVSRSILAYVLLAYTANNIGLDQTVPKALLGAVWLIKVFWIAFNP